MNEVEDFHQLVKGGFQYLRQEVKQHKFYLYDDMDIFNKQIQEKSVFPYIRSYIDNAEIYVLKHAKQLNIFVNKYILLQTQIKQNEDLVKAQKEQQLLNIKLKKEIDFLKSTVNKMKELNIEQKPIDYKDIITDMPKQCDIIVNENEQVVELKEQVQELTEALITARNEYDELYTESITLKNQIQVKKIHQSTQVQENVKSNKSIVLKNSSKNLILLPTSRMQSNSSLRNLDVLQRPAGKDKPRDLKKFLGQEGQNEWDV